MCKMVSPGNSFYLRAGNRTSVIVLLSLYCVLIKMRQQITKEQTAYKIRENGKKEEEETRKERAVLRTRCKDEQIPGQRIPNYIPIL